MLKALRNAALVAVASLGLSACANIYENAKDASPTGDAYSQALFTELMAIADAERRQEDWTDANYHAGRALAVANGGTIEPTPPEARDLGPEFSGELQSAYSSLNRVLAEGAASEHPGVAAKAFAGYECWLEQAEEGHQADDIVTCKNQFNEAMATLTAEPVATGPWKVFFPTDVASVDFEGQQAVSAAADAATANPDATLIVQGHTDTVGSEEYNLELSKRRAQSVVEILNNMGISTDRMTVGAVGESELLVPTADGVPEQDNRVTVMRLVE